MCVFVFVPLFVLSMEVTPRWTTVRHEHLIKKLVVVLLIVTSSVTMAVSLTALPLFALQQENVSCLCVLYCMLN
jgi:hypothetical protein